MPATKKPGDEVFSGSTCKQGEIEAVVIATGVHTFFGKAAHLVDSTNNVGHFQKVSSITFPILATQAHVVKFLEVLLVNDWHGSLRISWFSGILPLTLIIGSFLIDC